MAPFQSQYPLSSVLGVTPVTTAAGQHPGYDYDQLSAKLGTTRFNNLTAWLVAHGRAVFCCGHRTWPANYADATKRLCEVHCVFAADLEEFLKGGG